MPTESREWPVGDRTCVLRVQVSRTGALGPASISWQPDRPAKLSAVEWAEFRLGRRAALAEIERRHGRAVDSLLEAN